MRFALNFGTEVDLATPSEVEASVDKGVGQILERLPSGERGARLRPTSSVNVTPAATGTFILDMGKPAPGTLWWLWEVVVTAADDHTALAGGLAALYCGLPGLQSGVASINYSPALGQLVRPAIAIPGSHQFSGEPWPVKDGENLTVVVYSPTTVVSVLSATATVMQIDDRAVSWNRSPGTVRR